MERDCVRHPNINDSKNSRDRSGGDSSLLLRSSPDKTTTSEFVLQWGNRKRLWCMKIQLKDDSSGLPVTRTTVWVDRRVIRSDKDLSNQPSNSNGYLNLRQRPLSPLQRVLSSCLPTFLPDKFIVITRTSSPISPSMTPLSPNPTLLHSSTSDSTSTASLIPSTKPASPILTPTPASPISSTMTLSPRVSSGLDRRSPPHSQSL